MVSSVVIPSIFLQVSNLLNSEQLSNLLSYVTEEERNFQATVTSTQAENYRSSLVLYEFTKYREIIERKIYELLPNIFTSLKLRAFVPTQIEAQLTVHRNGDFYKVHNDDGSDEVRNRRISYAYYFYNEPKQFTGGELVLYDTTVCNGSYVAAESSNKIEPLNNSIVFFLSSYLHEVSLVTSNSQEFADNRFTINGWLRD